MRKNKSTKQFYLAGKIIQKNYKSNIYYITSVENISVLQHLLRSITKNDIIQLKNEKFIVSI